MVRFTISDSGLNIQVCLVAHSALCLSPPALPPLNMVSVKEPLRITKNEKHLTTARAHPSYPDDDPVWADFTWKRGEEILGVVIRRISLGIFH
ncbi:hypothetical protein R1flu_002893 [Riccia fluitans]|uniref:Uncharacterized protein n=1 Tax=Riccia fluitans TaxID=41844 RepID=A0ABD1Y7E7_9MARC